MARKKARAPSPPPRPREEPSSDEEVEEGEEEATPTPATQNAPQTSTKPPSTDAADADSSDGGEEQEEQEEESSDSETDANAFQLRKVAPSAADEEDGSSSDSPDLEPIQKKKKPNADAGKKRRAAHSSPSPSPSGGKPKKKAKTDMEKPAPPPPPPPPSGLNASRKGKKTVPDRSPSKPLLRRWTTEDEIKILEALVSHVKATGTQPGAMELIAAIGDSLERKNCTKTEMYEKVRNLRQRHEKAAATGVLPGNDDDLRKFNLSEAVWGEGAKEAAAATVSQNAGPSTKTNKGQLNREKADGHSKGGAAKESAVPVSPVIKSKKRGNHSEELEEDAKADIPTKETTKTATQNGGTVVRGKSGMPDKEAGNGGAASLGPKEAENGGAASLGPKAATAVTQNDDALFKDGESHEEKMDTDHDVKNVRRGFDELQNLYPNLASYVERIQAQHPCGETLKRAFEFIADDKACALEAKIKKQRVAEMKMEIRQADTKKEVANLLIGLMD